MRSDQILQCTVAFALTTLILVGCVQDKIPGGSVDIVEAPGADVPEAPGNDVSKTPGNDDVLHGPGTDVPGKPPESDGDGVTPPANATQYFIAIHCDPNATFPGEFINLGKMIDEADTRGIKLTLMFTPQWANFILEEPPRKAKLEGWAADGHEIAMHHHSIYHPGTWDQYTDFEFDEYAKVMGLPKAEQQEKLGNLDDLSAILESLYPGIDSGCAADERDKRVLPDTVVKDTCSGFYTNYAYPVGTRADATDPLMGVNDFVLVGKTENGIERRWLSHGMISAPFIDGSEIALKAMEGGAHGVIVHTRDADQDSLVDWMTRLISYDGGAGTSTVSAIIESGALPEEPIDGAVLNTVYESEGKDKGDGPPGGGDGPPGE